jgi:CBS domain-containing protein
MTPVRHGPAIAPKGAGFITIDGGTGMTKARDIMTANPQVVTPGDSVTRAAEIMRDADVGVVPVVEDQGSMRLAGVVTDRDIAVRVVAEGRNGETSTRDVMSTGLSTVGPDDDVSSVLNLMKSEQVRRIPVVEGDRLVGIIAQADVATDLHNDRKTGDVVEKISEPQRK